MFHGRNKPRVILAHEGPERRYSPSPSAPPAPPEIAVTSRSIGSFHNALRSIRIPSKMTYGGNGEDLPLPFREAPNDRRKRHPNDATATLSCAAKTFATQYLQPRVMDPITMDRLTLYGSFTSSSSYKPMLYSHGAAAVFVPHGQSENRRAEDSGIPRDQSLGVVPSLRHRGLTILQSNVILDYLARETGRFEGASEQQRWQAREWLSWEADHITRWRGAARGAVPPGASRSHRRISTARRGGVVVYRQDSGDRHSSSAKAARSPISVAGAAWCSWPRAVSTSRTGRISKPGRRDSRRCLACAALRSDPEQGSRVRPGLITGKKRLDWTNSRRRRCRQSASSVAAGPKPRWIPLAFELNRANFWKCLRASRLVAQAAHSLRFRTCP